MEGTEPVLGIGVRLPLGPHTQMEPLDQVTATVKLQGTTLPVSKQVSSPSDHASSGHWSPCLGEVPMALRPQGPGCSCHILSGLLLHRQRTGSFDLDLKVSGPQF